MSREPRVTRDGRGRAEQLAASDPQVEQMVTDPAGYFTRSRQEARSEARRYVAKRLREPRPA